MRKNIRLKEAAMKELRRLVHERDGNACVLCGWPYGLDCHHVIFRSGGGEDVSTNLVSLCRKCHTIYAHGRKAKAYRGEFQEYLQAEHCLEFEKENRAALDELYERGRK